MLWEAFSEMRGGTRGWRGPGMQRDSSHNRAVMMIMTTQSQKNRILRLIRKRFQQTTVGGKAAEIIMVDDREL